MSKDVVNESSALSLEVAFFTRPGQRPVTPETVRYRNKDVTNDRVVRDWTAIASASIVTIEVPAGDNSVYHDTSKLGRYFEERVVVVQANYGTDSQYAEEYRYLVKNLRGFES